MKSDKLELVRVKLYQLGFIAPLILIVIGLGIVLVGIIVYFQLRPSMPKVQSTPVPTAQPISTQSDETANWKTYESKEGKFSIKYPPSWTIDVPSSDAKNLVYSLQTSDKVIRYFSISVVTTSFVGSFEDWCKNDLTCKSYITGRDYCKNNDCGKDNLYIEKFFNGTKIYQHIVTDEQNPGNRPLAETYVPHNSTIYRIAWEADAKDSSYKFSDLVKEFNDPIFEKIFSTLKFTDDETTNWKTYNNIYFSVKYPKDWSLYSPGGGQFGEQCKETSRDAQIVELSKIKQQGCGFVGDQLPPQSVDFTIWISSVWENLNVLGNPDENLVIAGEKAVKYKFTDKSELPDTQAMRIYFNHNNKGYLIFLKQTDKNGNYDSTYNQIISTFKFL